MNIILLHGLRRDHTIMLSMEQALREAQWDTYNFNYPSTRYSIEILAQQIAERIRQHVSPTPLYFVTHSLGSIILRYMHAHSLIPPVLRAVMLGPPNHGTAIIDYLKQFKWFTRYLGPAAMELATDAQGIYHRLPEPIDFDCGIIAGNRTREPWFSWTLLKTENDGKVTVESTQLKGMRDHIIVPTWHARLPKDPQVIQQTIYFLKEGRFMLPHLS